MKKFTVLLLPTFGLQAHAQTLKGIIVLASDGTFLGVCDNAYNRLSIINDYGYGSKYKAESINNPYGRYGSDYSLLSPYNKYTLNSPYLFGPSADLLKMVTSSTYHASSELISSLKTYSIGRLTVNKSVPGAVNPEVFKALCSDQ